MSPPPDAVDKLKEVFTYFLAAMAMLALLCAAYEAMNQRVATATLLAGIAIAAALLMYLPQMISFKAFGVEATLQDKINDADKIIKQMKRLAAANAQATCSLLAWGNRWNGMPPDEKQKIADQIDTQLKSFDFDDQDRADIKGNYVYFIAYDMGSYFENALGSYVIRLSSVEASGSSELLAWNKEWSETKRLSFDRLSKVDGQGLAEMLSYEVPRDKIKPEDVAKFEKFANRIGVIYSKGRSRQYHKSRCLRYSLFSCEGSSYLHARPVTSSSQRRGARCSCGENCRNEAESPASAG
jgi:hypothetical protein